MNVNKHMQYLYFLASPEQKIGKEDKVERVQLYAKKWRAIKEFGIDSQGQHFHVAQKKSIL